MIELLFPRVCAICERPERRLAVVEPDTGLKLFGNASCVCQVCASALCNGDRRCTCCSAPLPEGLPLHHRCPHCCDQRWAFRRAYAYGMYEGPLQEAILKSKKPIYEYLAAELGRRMAAWFARQEHEAYDCVVSTPQFWLKRLVRRTNSSEILAEAMAQSMRIPWHARWLRCRRMLRKQGTLKYAQRQKNVRGAFATNWWSRFAGKSVLLVDDILTSGAIGSELAATMKRSGAKHVDVVVVARGVGRHGIAGRAAQVDPMPGSRSTEKTIP